MESNLRASRAEGDGVGSCERAALGCRPRWLLLPDGYLWMVPALYERTPHPQVRGA